MIKSLLDSGLKLESVRKVFDYMREQLGEDISSANLVINGSSSVLVRSGEELIDVVRQGQGVLNVLAAVRREGRDRRTDRRAVHPASDTDQVETELESAGHLPHLSRVRPCRTQTADSGA